MNAEPGRRPMSIDYYPLVSRAVSALKSDTAVARDALFERLRKILSDQLQNRQAPVSRSEMMRERAALEVAIRKVEFESVPRVRDLRSHKNSAVGEQRAGRLQVIVKRAKALFAERLQELGHLAAVIRERFSDAIEEVAGYRSSAKSATSATRASSAKRASVSDTDHGGSAVKSEIANNSAGKTPILWDSYSPTDQSIISGDSVIVRNLVGVQLLDGLMRTAAQPLALDTVMEDARIVLKWLGVRSADEIDAQHYVQFASAVHKYALEYQDQSVRLAPSTAESPSELNCNIRGVLCRLLERAQTERVFNAALSWFGTIWIGLFTALNLVALISLPAVGGITKLEEIYSPLNVGTWIAEVLALSPGVIAILWKDRRMRHSCGVAVATLAPNASAAATVFNAPITSEAVS
jgi:hypothetical protein